MSRKLFALISAAVFVFTFTFTTAFLLVSPAYAGPCDGILCGGGPYGVGTCCTTANGSQGVRTSSGQFAPCSCTGLVNGCNPCNCTLYCAPDTRTPE